MTSPPPRPSSPPTSDLKHRPHDPRQRGHRPHQRGLTLTQITASTVSLTVDDVTASQAFLTTHLRSEAPATRPATAGSPSSPTRSHLDTDHRVHRLAHRR